MPGCSRLANELWTGLRGGKLFPEFRLSVDIPEIEKIVKSYTNGKVERYINI